MLPLKRFSIPLLAFIFIYSTFNLNYHREDWKKNVRTDGMGYYAYLPALFIYHDLEFDWVDSCLLKGIIDSTTFSPFAVWQKTGSCNKYYWGTSLSIMPFFLIAHGYAHLTGEPMTGYSKPYLMGVSFAAIFYALAGLYLFQILCSRYIKHPVLLVALVWGLGLGTQVYYYAVCEPSMSHVYSFFFVVLFIFSWIKYLEAFRPGYLSLCAAALALITLIRPINVLVVLFLPFLSSGIQPFVSAFRHLFSAKKTIILPAILLASLLFTQLLIYKIQTGKWLIDSYSVESFNFTVFNLDSFLLSYKKGLFTYTPILFICFAALISFRRNPSQILLFIIPFSILSYVLSSWWMWFYGGSFGMRAMLEYFPVLFIPLAQAAGSIRGTLRTNALIALLALFIIHCQMQTMQYRHAIIHWADMDATRYWDTYCKPPYNWLF